MLILLVEDEAIIALTTKLQLQNFGYKVIHVSSGERAIFLSLFLDFDIILMDVSLQGISGITTAEILSKEGIETPIIFLSSYTEENIVKEYKGSLTKFYFANKNLMELGLTELITQVVHEQTLK